MNGDDTLLTVRQLQDLLQVDRITIYRMLGDGRLHGFKVGGQWRFSRQSIEGWLRQQEAGLETAIPPAAGGDLAPSPEALPLPCIRAIQEIFAQALGVGAVTTATDGTPLTPLANGSEFCALIQGTASGRQACVATWRESAAGNGDRLLPATCHAGLHFVSAPVKVRGQSVAAVHAGHYLDEPPAGEAWTAHVRGLAVYGLDERVLRRALFRVPVLNGERQQQLAHLLKQMAATFSGIGEERLSLLGRLRRIAEITQM